MMRLFVALPLPEMVRARLALLQGGVPGGRWQEPATFHVTLRFVGEVDEPVAAELDGALARIAAPGFAIGLDGVGHFGTPRRPESLWVGVARSEPLQFLRDKVDRAAVAAGLEPDDRKYRPHVTLGRLRQAPAERVARWLADNALFMAGPIAVDRFVLYRSHLQASGAIHEPLAEYMLAED